MHQPKPFYRKQREQWEVEYEPGRRKKLCDGPENATTEAEAWKEYHRFMASLGRGEKVKDISLALAFDLFLDAAKESVAAETFEQYRIKLDDFVRHNRRLKLADLEPEHVMRWVKRHDWSVSTTRGAITAVKVCMAWCARKKYVPTDPVKDLKRPRMKRRERTLTPDERKAIRTAALGPLLDYLDALTLTGARPGEIMRLEAAHVDWDEAIAKLPGKTTRATGEMIELPLVPRMVEICRRLAEENPTGPLFRNSDGNPWTQNSVRCRMQRLRKKLGLEGVTAYTFRHSFATDALERGIPVTDLAALMNHKDIRTTMNYNHIKERRDHLGRQARKAVGDEDSPGSSSPS